MRILMISNHLGVQSGVQRYVQNLLLNLDTAKYHIDLFVGQCPADQASTAPARTTISSTTTRPARSAHRSAA